MIRASILGVFLGCTGHPLDEPPASDGKDDSPASGIRLPPANAGLDYQLGGAYPPPATVDIVSRDRTAPPAEGRYNICYINGFQIQPDEEALWLDEHPDLVLRGSGGAPVIDPDWNEMLIDVGTPAKRDEVANIVGDWIDGCADAGFDAIEIDNLDTYARSGGLLSEADNIEMMHAFADRAHARRLAIAQKNAAELVDRKDALGTDFVVTEECNRFDECDVYTAAYDDHVLVIEYRRTDFDVGCQRFPGLSIVFRDLELLPEGAPGHLFEGC